MTLLSILLLSLVFGAVIGTIAAFWLSFEFIQVAESRIEKTESKSENQTNDTTKNRPTKQATK